MSYARCLFSGAVGTDEDTYGQEMALYLNEDDILKPGESNEDDRILKFCNRANPGMIAKTVH